MVGSNAKEFTGEHPGISFKDLKEAQWRLWVRESESPIKTGGLSRKSQGGISRFLL